MIGDRDSSERVHCMNSHTKGKKPYWRGVFPAITTQLKKDQTLDIEATARHAEKQIGRAHV